MAADLYPHSNNPLEEMMGNLKLDPSTNSNLANMEASPSDATSCISSTGGAAGSFKEREVDHEPLTMPFSATNYYGYYYPGYTGSLGGPDDQGYYLTGGGLEVQYPVVQADNGSLIYFMPGFQPGYNSYTPFLPAAAVAFDGQYPYQHPYPSSPLFPLPATDFSGNFPTHIPYGSEFVPSSYLWDTSQLGGDGAYANGYAVGSDVLSSKSASVNGYASGHTRAPSKSASDSKNTIETKGVSPALISSYHGARSQLKGFNKASQHGSTFQPEAVVTKGYFPITKFPPYHHGKGGWLYPNSSVNVKANGRVWSGFDKLKTRNKTNGISDFALLNEQHHGPRTANAKNALVSEDDAAVSLAVDVNKSSNCLTSLVRADQYNLPNFSTKYEHAFFFVIKSYSEDDIHKSIKYSVWASTPNGNKRLDSAYQEAQGRMEDKGSKCPVFLFFSVNASGQFCGVAEMIGRVDFSKSVDFWQQDKWNGSFPVKWHIIKDIPNPQIRHIILENNDNKPVTNSRDTQEVRFPQGIELLSIFKNNVSKTSILDDFEFYESRQKVMQEKRIRPSLPHFGGVQQKAGNLNPGFQAAEVFAVKDVDKIQIGEKTSD